LSMFLTLATYLDRISYHLRQQSSPDTGLESPSAASLLGSL
jgi:hypothetical protein